MHETYHAVLVIFKEKKETADKKRKILFTVALHSFSGGFKIELLDKEEKLLRSLTPMAESKRKDGFIGEDPTQQHYSVQVPSSTCVGCTVCDSFLLVQIVS